MYDEVFKSDLVTLKGVEIKLTVNPNCEPKFCKTRPVPDALKEQIEKELVQLIANDFYEPIQCIKQTTPSIPVLKDGSSVKICGGFKQIINQVSLFDKYPVLKTEDLLAVLHWVKFFLNLTLVIHTYCTVKSSKTLQ